MPHAWVRFMLVVGLLSEVPAPLGGQPAPPAQARAAIWLADVPGADPRLAGEIAGLLQSAGYATNYLDSLALTNSARLSASEFDLLVLPGARLLPADAVASIEGYLRAGGHLLALGLPAWQTPLFRWNGEWLSQAAWTERLAAQSPQASLIDFAAQDLAKWTRHTDNPASGGNREQTVNGGVRALHVVIENLGGWDTLASPPINAGFVPGHTLTCFRAKGGPATTQLALEWLEQDRSRWIATVDLTPDWKNYALPPEAFRPWQPPPNRRRAGDKLNVQKVAQFTVGLAASHTALPAGRHEYWLANVGSAPNPFGDVALPAKLDLPRIESLTPEYQCFPVAGPVVIRSVPRQALATDLEMAWDPDWSLPEAPRGSLGRAGSAMPAPLLQALHPRPGGAGFGLGRQLRWQPLLVAYDRERRDYRGAVAARLLHSSGPYKGGVWTLLTPAETAFYRQAQVRKFVVESMRRVRAGLFLQEAGAEFFTLFADQDVRVGARVVNLGHQERSSLRVKLSVLDRQTRETGFTREWPLTVAPGASETVEETWHPSVWPANQCVVVTELMAGPEAVDRLEHELNRWQPKPQPKFMTVTDGTFRLGDQPWKAHGVNYMPSSGIGVGGEQFEYWLDSPAYDPEIIQRDLTRISALGLNAVSAFVFHRSLAGQRLLDFLFRCDQLGLRVNLSLRPGTPMDFRWSEMKALIEHHRLAQNDTVFAYDLAWEPSHFDHSYQQQHYAGLWREWVRKRHGSLETALSYWGVPAPASLTLERLAVPAMRQLTQDGAWRKLAADYRAFLDELLRARYASARDLVRGIDPHHPVSFRMQHAGNPTLNWEQMLPYDMFGLAGAVDIWEPEAYGRIGDWDKVKAGTFTAAYARLCDPAKPIVWAEMGYNTWDMNLMAPHPQKLDIAARFYTDFYRMLRESGADGVFFWWYAGGFRLNENSDFGILNPDGTDRSITRVIRQEGPAFLAAPKPPAPSRWIMVDRDRDARGLFGIYEAVKQEFWQAHTDGKPAGLKWQRLPGGP